MTTAGHSVHTNYYGSGSKIPVPVTRSPALSSSHSNTSSPSPTKSRINNNYYASNPSGPPRFEAYMMTGDIIISLANTKSGDNTGQADRSGFRNRPFTRSNNKNNNNSINNNYNNNINNNNINNDNNNSNNNYNYNYNHCENMDTVKTNSLPTSPVESLCENAENQNSNYYVRLSKSEDGLDGTFVIGQLDGDDCNQSNSLDTLLNRESNCNSNNGSAMSSFSSSPSNDGESSTATPNGGKESLGPSTGEDISSLNSPTKATITGLEQTDSSMSERYSIVSSLNVGSKCSKSKRNYQAHINTLSWSSSCETECSSTISSPPDLTLDTPSTETPKRRLGENNGSESNTKRYPSFISPNVEQKEEAPSVSGTSIPSSSSENESSEDELESLNYYSPPRTVDTASASRLAKRLYNLEGFKRSDVCRHLSKNNDFSKAVAEEYVKYFNFKGDKLDSALRKFLNEFCLIGETQERERVLQHFSRRYLDCNPGSFKSADSLHTLTCAVMLLNTDLYGENVLPKMTCNEFINNLSSLHEGENFNRDLLIGLYQSIKAQPLQWAFDNDDLGGEEKSRLGLITGNTNLISIGSNPFLKVPNPNSGTEFKRGYIMRKSCFDSNGKRTPIGKRGWKMFYATLRDLVLYLHKDEQGFRKNQLYESLHNSIRIHHALASNANDYTKKQFVFRLQTPDQCEYLFQTSDARELQSWVDTINLVAATFSAPPLSSGVGSQSKKFQKPLLPSSHTKLNLRDQLVDHETRLSRLKTELEEHGTKHPEKGASKRILSEYAEKQGYLQYEIERYTTYASLLRSKLEQAFGSQVLSNQMKVSSITSKCKPLTSLSIGEEPDADDEERLDLTQAQPVIKPVRRNDR